MGENEDQYDAAEQTVIDIQFLVRDAEEPLDRIPRRFDR